MRTFGELRVSGVRVRCALLRCMHGHNAGGARWLPVSDTGSATAGGMAAAPMLAASRHLASTARPKFAHGALAGVERAFCALPDAGPSRAKLRGSRKGGLADGADTRAGTRYCFQEKGW
jgi:hypothetical protein